ncbi:hypothetical protein [Ulvibacterium marinum]|uniref:Uncharacterized protein n=1 Tax=Ulvibacterium marinum TaxID=2419782 RepID=A0A3B0BVD8_9FLAO|nr:hypothetical protein [Ulvibacterium marinum]RKN76810.1 hypothetical protein D7Z94_23805 [Ulvibacterium marinum]
MPLIFIPNSLGLYGDNSIFVYMFPRHSNIPILRVLPLLICLTFWSGTELFSQIKIGDNPQNIDSGSLLELESNELALVITRVTTQQMNRLSPMAGALVYNAEVGCVYAYDGAVWINLCTQGGAGGVSTAPGNVITDNGGAFYDDGDTNAQNELTDLELSGTRLMLTNPLTGGNTIDLAPILGSGDPSDELIVDGTVIGNDLIINEGTGNQVIIDVSNLANGDNSTFEVNGGNLNITDDAGTLSVPLTDFNNLSNTDLTQTGGNRTYDLNNQNLVFSGAGNLGVNVALPQAKLHIGGNLRIDGQLLDSDGDGGTPGQLLSATNTGTDWVSPIVSTGPFHALGKMNESVIVNGANVLTTNSMGIGEYRIFFTANASSEDYVVQLSLLNTGAASIEVISQTVGGFTVQIYDNDGIAMEGDWFFTVVDF